MIRLSGDYSLRPAPAARRGASFSFRILTAPEDFAHIYARLVEQNLLWTVWPDIGKAEWSEDIFVSRLADENTLVLGIFAAKSAQKLYTGSMILAGIILARPARERSLAAEIGLTAFRPYFKFGLNMCRAGLGFLAQNLKPAPMSFIGYVPAPSRHILRLLGKAGFAELGRIPGLYWYARQQKFVPAAVVLANACEFCPSVLK